MYSKEKNLNNINSLQHTANKALYIKRLAQHIGTHSTRAHSIEVEHTVYTLVVKVKNPLYNKDLHTVVKVIHERSESLVFFNIIKRLQPGLAEFASGASL